MELMFKSTHQNKSFCQYEREIINHAWKYNKTITLKKVKRCETVKNQ